MSSRIKDIKEREVDSLFSLLEDLSFRNYKDVESVTQEDALHFGVTRKPNNERVTIHPRYAASSECSLDARVCTLLIRLQYGSVAANTFRPSDKWSFHGSFHKRIFGASSSFAKCDQIVQEMRRLQCTRGYHHVQPLLSWCTRSSMLYVSLASCHDYLEQFVLRQPTSFQCDSPFWKQLVRELGTAVEYMHGMQVVHLGITTTSVLVRVAQEGVSFYLGDFRTLRDVKQASISDWSGGDNVHFWTPYTVQNRRFAAGRRGLFLPGADVYAFAVTVLASLWLPEKSGFVYTMDGYVGLTLTQALDVRTAAIHTAEQCCNHMHEVRLRSRQLVDVVKECMQCISMADYEGVAGRGTTKSKGRELFSETPMVCFKRILAWAVVDTTTTTTTTSCGHDADDYAYDSDADE